MASQGADHTSQGDLMRRVRELERKVQRMETARRLESASIGQGGITIQDGGNLVVEDGGDIIAQDEDGTDRLTFGEGDALRYFDVDGNGRAFLGNFQGAGQGIAIFTESGIQAVTLQSSQVLLRPGEGGDGVLALSPTEDDTVELQDDSGSLRAVLGPVLDGGTPAGYGVLVQDASGDDLLFACDGRAVLSAFATGGGFVEFDGDGDDQIDLYDPSGNLRATVGPVSWSGSPDGYGIYLTDGSGTDRFFASANRIWLRTTNGEQGEVTAGAADSAGSGFRTLRIPN